MISRTDFYLGKIKNFVQVLFLIGKLLIKAKEKKRR